MNILMNVENNLMCNNTLMQLSKKNIFCGILRKFFKNLAIFFKVMLPCHTVTVWQFDTVSKTFEYI